MLEHLDPKVREKIENDPALKEAVEKVYSLYTGSDLSGQIGIKIWAAMIAIRQEKVEDSLIGDILNKGFSILKCAHTIELTNMILDGMHKAEKRIVALDNEEALGIFSELGAVLEGIHNRAAALARTRSDQFQNLLCLIPTEGVVSSPESKTDESHPA